MQQISRTFRSVVLPAALPVTLLAVVLGLDVVATSRRWGLLIAGLLDEPAHLATAVLLLIAVAGPGWLRLHRRFAVAAGIASVAIDVDHIPLYARIPHIAVDGGRPFTHSLATVVVLLLAGAAVPRGRAVLLGLAAGVALHLFRDLASGPGVSLFWPIHDAGLHLRYGWYAALLVAAVLLGTLRIATDRRLRSSSPDSTVAADVRTSTATGAE